MDIEDRETYSNGEIEVIVDKHFLRFEDRNGGNHEHGMVDFLFAVDTKTGETILRTQKEFKKEFVLGSIENYKDKRKVETMMNFFDSYILNGQVVPSEKSKEEFVEHFKCDYILTIAASTTNIQEHEFLNYAPIYYDKHLTK